MNYGIDATVIQMNEPWHIPRASLSSQGSSVKSQKSNSSNHSSVRVHRQNGRGHTNRAYQTEAEYSSGSEHEARLRELQNRFDEYSQRKNNGDARNKRRVSEANPKRGSRSSQGSTDSNQSSQSASSGSLLLTVANLEHFTQFHQNRSSIPKLNVMSEIPESIARTKYNTNITLPPPSAITGTAGGGICGDGIRSDDTSIPIDPNLFHAKAKDVDTLSIASSTHFTVVNGMGGPQRITKDGGLCSRGHQITVLILSMSFVFLIGIVGAVFLLEMRARDMPK